MHFAERYDKVNPMIRCYCCKSGLQNPLLFHGASCKRETVSKKRAAPCPEQLNKEGEGMSKRETYEKRTEEFLAPIAAAQGVEIYDVEYVKEGSDWYLRAYIDKPEGVNIGDCEAVSRALSDALDAEDFIEGAYTLEVSSPGLGRALKKDRHLEKSIGRQVELRLYQPVEKGREFSGVLKGYTAQEIVIETAQEEMTFARKDIALIRLALDF